MGHFSWSIPVGVAVLPAFGDNVRGCLGVVIFNFAFCVTIPSWLKEKKPEVSVAKTLWGATTFSAVLYTAVGVCGAIAFDLEPGDFLSLLMSEKVPLATRVGAVIFGLAIIGLGIPIFCIMMRANLEDGLCGPRLALFLGCVFPWMVAWLFYQETVTGELLAWSGRNSSNASSGFNMSSGT